MSDLTKTWIVLIAWSFLMVFIGFAIGIEKSKGLLQTEIINLSIELTKLEIKKLKARGE